MRLSRTKNAVVNSFWGVIEKLVLMLLPFVIRTFIIKSLGAEYLGLNSLFTSVLKILNLSELGFGTAIVFSMYAPIADNDEDLICALMNLYRNVYRIIGIVVLAIGMVLIPFLSKLIHGDIPADIDLYVLYIIYLFNSVISYWLFAYKSSLLNAHQRTDILSKVSLATNVAMYTLQIIILIEIKNYYAYVIVYPFFTIIQNIINAILAKKMYPRYFCRGNINNELKADIKKRVTGLMINKITYASRNALDSIIVSAFLGLTTVAMYNNYYYISSSVTGLMVVFMHAISAGIGNSIVLETVEKNEKDIRSINFIYMTISLLCFTCFMAIYQPFMTLWVGKDLLFSNSVMIAFSIYFLVEKTLNVVGQYYEATGLWWQGKFRGIIETVANLILNILLCKFLGVIGIVIATIVTILFIGFPLVSYYLYKYYFHKSCRKFLLEQYSYVIAFSSIGCISYYFTLFIPVGTTMIMNIIFIFVKSVVGILISLVLYIVLFHKNKQFLDAKEWGITHFRNILLRRKKRLN